MHQNLFLAVTEEAKLCSNTQYLHWQMSESMRIYQIQIIFVRPVVREVVKKSKDFTVRLTVRVDNPLSVN